MAPKHKTRCSYEPYHALHGHWCSACTHLKHAQVMLDTVMLHTAANTICGQFITYLTAQRCCSIRSQSWGSRLHHAWLVPASVPCPPVLALLLLLLLQHRQQLLPVLVVLLLLLISCTAVGACTDANSSMMHMPDADDWLHSHNTSSQNTAKG